MDYSDAQAIMAAQAEVHDGWEKVEAYGAAIPDVWLQAIYYGTNLVALLADPDTHRDRLLALVEHPDRLTVRHAPFGVLLVITGTGIAIGLVRAQLRGVQV